jgi:ArsR family transcriptional regulator
LQHPINVATTKQVDLSEQQLSLIAKALADPRRYEILKKITMKTCATPCSSFRDCMEISPATLSHHMKELETAGLVRSEKDGKFVNYFPQTEVLRAYLTRLKFDLI